MHHKLTFTLAVKSVSNILDEYHITGIEENFSTQTSLCTDNMSRAGADIWNQNFGNLNLVSNILGNEVIV